MRSATGPELTVLAGTTRQETLRVKVANGSGTMIDLSSWVVAYSIDGDKDQPVGGAKVLFSRASGSTLSLSPLRTDSTLNRLDDHVTYAPQLDINRAITIELATTAMGTAPVSGDYKLLFKGTIDLVDFDQTPISVTCRDQGAQIVDRDIEVPKSYGSGPGVAVETVMQSILDDTFGVSVIPLYTPSSPSYLISPAYQQQVMSVMDAEVALAQLPGFDVRYKWDDGTSAFRFTLSNPPRSKTTPDYTFGPSAYYNVTTLTLDVTNVRNVIIVNYADSADFGNRHTVTVSDATSITKYGRRVLIITEADTSPINTSTEATTLGNAALADLKDPKADQEVELPLFWPGDLDDLYRFSANGVHYNSNQDLAVVQITHSGQKTSTGFRHRTHVKVRGSPIGQYGEWLARGGTIGGPTVGGQAIPPTPYIIPRNTETDDTTWDLQFYATNGSGGGGTNLTYTITLKKTFGATTTLSSGNASAFPLNLTVARDPKYDGVLTFTVTDAATGLSRFATWNIPMQSTAFNSAGLVIGTNIVANTVGPGQTNSRFRCKVFNSAAQSIPNTTLTNLTFDTELWDSNSLHSTSSNTDRITVPTGGDVGNWFVSATVAFAANATGRREIRLLHWPPVGGPSTLIAEAIIPGLSDGGIGPCITISGMAQPAAAGDFYVIEVWQNSTAALNVQNGVTQFSATHVW